MLDLRAIRHFVRIVELGSLTKAAQQAHISQPALSQKIAGLEREFGIKLLDLGPKGASPTEAGNVLYHDALALLRQAEEVRLAVLSTAIMPVGTVIVGLPTTTAEILSLPLLEASRRRYPKLWLQITALPRCLVGEMLVDGRLDVAILFDQPSRKGVLSYPLAAEELYLVTGPANSGAAIAERVTLSEIAALPLLLPRCPHPSRLLLEAAFNRAGLSFKVAAELDSVTVLLDAVRAGWGATLLPWSAFHRVQAQGHVSGRPLVERMERVMSVCVSDARPTTSAAAAVRETMVEMVENLVNRKAWCGLTVIASRTGSSQARAPRSPPDIDALAASGWGGFAARREPAPAPAAAGIDVVVAARDGQRGKCTIATPTVASFHRRAASVTKG
jgi:LysR family nitrogen assimilation transcriptional regulator